MALSVITYSNEGVAIASDGGVFPCAELDRFLSAISS